MTHRKIKYSYILKWIFTLILSFHLFSCILKVPVCPLPQCEIRKMHRHLLIFSETPKDKKKLFSFLKKKNKKSDSTSTDSLVADSAVASNKKGKNKKHKVDTTAEHHAQYVEVDGEILDEEGNVYEDEKELKAKAKKQKKADKKAAKKKKKEDKLRAKGKLDADSSLTEQNATTGDEDVEDDKYSGMTEEEYKQYRLHHHHQKEDTTHMHEYNERELAKQLKKEDKKAAKAQKKEDKLARKGKKGQADYTKIYRSRITRWWRRDQNPKTGKYYRKRKGTVYKT